MAKWNLPAGGAAPKRLTPEMIEDLCGCATYFQHGTLTICVLELKNGATVTGESNVIDPANYNEDLGKQLARDAAKEKIWQLEGYAMKTRG